MLKLLRQLYLLLWKNFILRKRKKIRILIEIIWPLFLFLILMWVRTRGLRTNEQACYFAERTLPSGGILPFIRGYICELNNTCYANARSNAHSTQLSNLTKLTSDIFQLFNTQSVVQSASTIISFANVIADQRSKAYNVTSQLKLSQVLKNESLFIQTLSNLTIYPDSIDNTTLNIILNSNPNYNYLYSNYSQTFDDPLNSPISLGVSQDLLDFLYGSDMDQMYANRVRNQVANATWIRSLACQNGSTSNSSSTSSLNNVAASVDFFRVASVNGNSSALRTVICGLGDDQLVSLMQLVSSQIDFTYVKYQVYENTPISDASFFIQALDAYNAFVTIQSEFNDAQILANNNLTSFSDLISKFQNINLEQTICGGSALNLFTLINTFDFSGVTPDFLNTFVQSLDQNGNVMRDSRILTNNFQLSSNAWSTTEKNGRMRSFKEARRGARKKPSESYMTSISRIVSADGNLTNATETEANQTDPNEVYYDNLAKLTSAMRAMNKLKNVSNDECPVQRPEADLDTASQLLVNSTTKSCFCQTIYSILTSLSEDTQTLFNQIKPMFLGKILYAPNSPAYDKLIKRANATFANIEKTLNLVGSIGDLGDRLLQSLNLSAPDTIASLQSTLNKALKIVNPSLTSSVNIKYYVIQAEFVVQLLKFTDNIFHCFELNKFQGYSSEAEAVQVGIKLIEKEAFWSAIIFQNQAPNDYELPDLVNYKIRMNSSQTHDTTYTQDRFYSYGPSNCLGCNAYFLYGFIYIQDMLEKSIIEMKTNLTQSFGIAAQMTPYPCYVNDKFVIAISRTLPLFMVLAWIYTVSMMVKDIVYEKEKRLKEFMRVMGLSNGTHWMAWFITSFITMFFVALLLCIIIKYGKITTYSEISVLFVFFCCFTMATITQCFLISIFFNRANLAAVVGGIIYFILYLPYTILVNYSDAITPWQKLLASLSSTVAFSYGCELIATYELQAVGVNWNNFYISPYTNKDALSMNTMCLMLLFDAFLYMLLTWYIEGIAPGEFGIPRRWYFPVQPSYWYGEYKFKAKTKALKEKHANDKVSSTSFLAKYLPICFENKKIKIIQDEISRSELQDKKRTDILNSLNDGKVRTNADYSSIEPIPKEANLVPGIEINNLHKVYSRGSNHALKGLSVKFYQNEISAFLGHNGAGKSTTMHILTGLYTATSGSAKINGLDINEQMDRIRKSLGFVPQHNVLFPGMTVEEHLWFYARLKGLDRKSTQAEMKKMLDDTGLKPKHSELAKNLSGGMQRKLSVAIAFVGGSKTVILDEPSAGVDPSGRRSIWDLLFKFRFGRTIIISTHHMDEADVLGDRIAIISNGKLVAHGSGYYLKHKYGRGYYLTFVKKQLSYLDYENENENEKTSLNKPGKADKEASPAKNDKGGNNSPLPSASSASSSNDSGAASLSSLSDSSSSITKQPKLSETDAAAAVTKHNMQKYLNEYNNENDLEDDVAEIQRKNEENVLKALSNPKDKVIHEFVMNSIPNAVLIENIGAEMTYSISNKAEYTKTYEKVFNQIERNMNHMGISSMGISDTTLEEIFIKLAKQPKPNTPESRPKSFRCLCCNLPFLSFSFLKKHLCCCCSREGKADEAKTLTEEQLKTYSAYTKLRVKSQFLLIFQQLYALLIKRFHRVKRNIKGFFAEIVLPVIFVCLALLVATLSPTVNDRPPLELHPWYYAAPNQIFLSKSSSINYDTPVYGSLNQSEANVNLPSNIDAINGIATTFLASPGLGTRCMKNHRIVITQQAQDYSRALGNRVLECNGDVSLVQRYAEPSSAVVGQLKSTNFSYTKISPDCDCSSGFPTCPASAGGDINYRQIVVLKSQDYMYDLSGRNVTDWLVKTEFSTQYFKKRFGGFEFITDSSDLDDQAASDMFTNVYQFTNNYVGLFNQFISARFPNASSTVQPINQISFEGSNPLLASQQVKIWYNLKGYDTNVAFLNLINNAMLRSATNTFNTMNNYEPSSPLYKNPNYQGIVAFNHPMPYTKAQFLNQLESRLLIDLFVAICIIFALSFIPASFLVFILEERETRSKQLQFISGVKPYIYWISNFIWDLINYIVPCALCILIFVIFDVKAYMSKENFPCLVSLMLLYGWACIPLMYPLNYIFNIPSTAFVISACLNVFIGVVSTMTTTILTQLGDDEPDLLKVNDVLKPLFTCLFPHYCLGQGFLEMSILYNTAEVKRGFGMNAEYSPFVFDSVGRNLLAMGIQGIIYFSLNLLIEYKFFIRFQPTSNVSRLNLPKVAYEDDDVANERKRILNNEASARLRNKRRFDFMRIAKKNTLDFEVDNIEQTDFNDTSDRDYIKLVNATKVYRRLRKFHIRRHVAVNSLSLGINKGECFGLIGVNGAGKTTTFKMITGDLGITGGDIYVNGLSVSKNVEKVHQNIGYCPQSDAIIPLLTAREHVYFFARLRGIPERYVKQVGEWAMSRVGLNVFADRISGDFSGGNKRKLSTAIALVGDPTVICLDEPTSGMDAKARRLLWNDILSLIKENRIVVLTSHSMEECEALCTRMVIMVNGQFKCLGSPQHLKTKFGNGYKLTIKLDNENDKDKLDRFMRDHFPTAVIQEMHKNLFEYVLPFSDNRLSQIFGKMEKNREYLNLKDYSVSQTTLDQVFVNFAKQQTEETFVDEESTQRDGPPIVAAAAQTVHNEPPEVKFEQARSAHANDKYSKKKKAKATSPKTQVEPSPIAAAAAAAQKLDKNNNLARVSKADDEEAIYDNNIQDLNNLKEMYQKSIAPVKDKEKDILELTTL